MSQPEADCAVGLRFTGDALPGLIAGIDDDLPEVTVERTADADLEARWKDAGDPTLVFARVVSRR